MTLDRLNQLSAAEAEVELLACCGSRTWARRVVHARPFATPEALLETADQVWRHITPPDWLEAFAAHPQIGERKPEHPEGATPRAGAWASAEQAGTQAASADVLARLREANRAYRERFGYIFIVCATGKSATEMLYLLTRRSGNDPDVEFLLAGEEQRKITALRLRKLLEG